MVGRDRESESERERDKYEGVNNSRMVIVESRILFWVEVKQYFCIFLTKIFVFIHFYVKFSTS